MNIIINNTSMQPIYEQIVEQIKARILQGRVKENDSLPSVRGLAKELHISALTVKKAYDILEQEGYVVTVHGKGSFVAGINPYLAQEEQRKEVEKEMEAVIRKGRVAGMSEEEIRQLMELLLEGEI